MNDLPTEPDSPLGATPSMLDTPGARRRRDDIRGRLFGGSAEPERLGRYEVVRRLGAGAIGVVYLCHDARLDRRVAVKVLRDPTADAARLRQEARAMARLSHPNVASVFEVGIHGDRVYVALEFIDGVTLRQWQVGRGAREIIDVYEQAGRGLAAAHRAGIVHRDFKPDNAMVGIDRGLGGGMPRVQVLDFGLARRLSIDDTSATQELLEVTSDDLTLTGETMGTPAYMPAEQLRGAEVDARADQFAFCVSLWEALFGERPFAGGSTRALYDAIVAGDVRRAPEGRVVASPVRTVLLRGLAARPDGRFAGMDALLVALSRARRSRLGTSTMVATGVIGLVLLAVVTTRSAAECGRADDALAEIWNPEIARHTRRDLIARDLSPAQAQAEIDETDRVAAAWREEARALCRPEPVDAEIRHACLQDVRESIGTRIRTLQIGTEVSHAARSLSLERCRELRASGGIPLTARAEQAVEVDRIQAAIGRTVDAGRAGDFAVAEATIEVAIAEARAIDEPALLAETLVLWAGIANARGKFAAAEHAAGAAYDVALAAGHDRLALRAVTEALHVVGHSQRRRDDGERWSRDGDALVARLPHDGRIVPDFLVNRGLMRIEHGELLGAREDLERARQIYVDASGPETADQLPAIDNLGHIAMLEGDVAQARALLDSYVALWEANPGQPQGDLVGALSNRSTIAIDQERFADALVDLHRAEAIASTGQPRPQHAVLLGNIAEVYYQQGRFAEAIREAEASLAMLRGMADADHPWTLRAQARLARVLAAAGDDVRAHEILQDTLVRAETRLGTDAPEVAALALELAGIDLRAGRLDAAQRDLARAQPVAGGEPLPCLALVSLARGAELSLVRGDATAVRAPLERGLDEASQCSSLERAEGELVLAHVRAATGQADAECRRLAASARDRWRGRGRDWDAAATAVDDWLLRLPTP